MVLTKKASELLQSIVRRMRSIGRSLGLPLPREPQPEIVDSTPISGPIRASNGLSQPRKTAPLKYTYWWVGLQDIDTGELTHKIVKFRGHMPIAHEMSETERIANAYIMSLSLHKMEWETE